MKLPRIFVILVLLGLLMGNMCVSAANIEQERSVSLGETCVITVPQPEGEIDEGQVYFQQEFLFVPQESGTYHFLISYDDDEQDPYDILLDVPGPYLELENGIEFDAVAGETFRLCFQYSNNDGRYPEFTFYLGTKDATQIPETGDSSLLILSGLMLTAAAAVVWLAEMRRKLI